MKMFVNDLILIPCVKTTEMFVCEKILTTSCYRNKIYSKPYNNGDTLLSCINTSLLIITHFNKHILSPFNTFLIIMLKLTVHLLRVRINLVTRLQVVSI